MPAVFIETFGCQMNVLDSELVGTQLEELGFQLVEAADKADIVLLNTCSVRDLAEHKVWSRLGRLGIIKEEQRDLVIGVIGCMAEREGEQIARRNRHVDLVCGASKLDRLPIMLNNVLENRQVQIAIAGHANRGGHAKPGDHQDLDELDRVRTRRTAPSPSRQSFVRITRGCNKFCSFCVVPFTRGPEVHRPPEQIIEETRRLVDNGSREVTLIGQTVNHYAYQDTRFADLLWRVHEKVPELPRLRFVTSYPRDFDDATLDVMARAERICRYLHLPVQSGSNRMLRAMNRGHTVEQYRELLDRARARMEDICLASDIIVGFPGETEEDHQATMALVREAQFKSCFVFKYSPRPKTAADERYSDDVPEETKKRRNLEVLELQAQISLKHNQRKVGLELEVLVEGHSKLRTHGDLIQLDGAPTKGLVRLVGRTRGDEIVAFDGDASMVGQIIKVKANGATPLTILAQPLMLETRSAG